MDCFLKRFFKIKIAQSVTNHMKNGHDLPRYQRMHNGNAFNCDVCEKRFDHMGNLNKHRVVHTLSKLFACDVHRCEKTFAYKDSVKAHKLQVHDEVSHVYRCEQCARTFAKPCDLRTHRQRHTRRRPFACTACAMKFIGKSELQGYFRAKHTTERPYECDICAQRFLTKHAVQRHRSAHTFAQPFACDVDGCKKKFRARTSGVSQAHSARSDDGRVSMRTLYAHVQQR
jgi:KRAB domain-containing zinc finger protein